MQRITLHLWFDGNAEGAVGFYESLFRNSQIIDTARYGEAGAEVSRRPVKLNASGHLAQGLKTLCYVPFLDCINKFPLSASE